MLKSQVLPRPAVIHTSIDPSRTFGIVSLILGLLMPPLGFTLGYFVHRSSAHEGHSNEWAAWGVIVGGTFTAVIAIIAAAQKLGHM